tara:strand:- start:12654 stop:13001 length:348 start_codon:yes stop_codon:yes gene_type:complete
MSSTSFNILPTISKTKTRKNISEIHQEYELIRKYIDQKKDSPNLFLNKLDNRFRMYFAKCKTYHENHGLSSNDITKDVEEEDLGIDDILAVEDKAQNDKSSQSFLEEILRFKKNF